MSTEEAPDEFTVIMKILDVVGKSLENSSTKRMNQRQRSQFVQIIGNISNSAVSGPLVNFTQDESRGDEYVIGQAGAVGPEATAANMQFHNVRRENSFAVDMGQLAIELKVLRGHLRKYADTPQEDEVVAEVSKAYAAAAEGDRFAVIQHLQLAGAWALEGAVSISATVAVAAINASIES